MADLSERIERIRRKLAENSIRLNPCCPLGRIEAFERKHEIALPEAYRRCISEVGDGGQGPPFYGICALEEGLGENKEDDEYWNQLPHILHEFPFTKPWIWEDDEPSPEGERYQVDFGSIRLGTQGCGQYSHLIVTGAERGTVWDFADVGIVPTDPKADFLAWYEAWLDLIGSQGQGRRGRWR